MEKSLALLVAVVALVSCSKADETSVLAEPVGVSVDVDFKISK